MYLENHVEQENLRGFYDTKNGTVGGYKVLDQEKIDANHILIITLYNTRLIAEVYKTARKMILSDIYWFTGVKLKI